MLHAELSIDLPNEARAPGEDDDVGRLNRSMIGFRDASHNWMREWPGLLQSGHAVAKAKPAFFNRQRNSRGAVQRGCNRTQGAKCCHPSTRFVRAIDSDSGIIIVLGASEGRRFVQIEPDTRHVELILKSLGLLESSNAVSLPGAKHTDDQVGRRTGEAQLSPTMTTVFRS